MKPEKIDRRKQNPGRPRKLDEPTVPIRVPASLADWIKANIDKIRTLANPSK